MVVATNSGDSFCWFFGQQLLFLLADNWLVATNCGPGQSVSQSGELLLSFASTVILGSRLLRIHDHIFLFHNCIPGLIGPSYITWAWNTYKIPLPTIVHCCVHIYFLQASFRNLIDSIKLKSTEIWWPPLASHSYQHLILWTVTGEGFGYACQLKTGTKFLQKMTYKFQPCNVTSKYTSSFARLPMSNNLPQNFSPLKCAFPAFCSFGRHIGTIIWILIGNRTEFKPRKRSVVGDPLEQG
jgi:hypothetical protein